MNTAPHVATSVQLMTPRLFLRELQENDVAVITAYMTLPLMGGNVLPKQTTPESAGQLVETALLHACMEPRTFYALGIVLKEEERLIGTCCLDNALPGCSAQIGWDLNPAYWGKGYMTEAAKAVVTFGFQHCRVQSLFADGFAHNKASIRVMEKLGMLRQSLSLMDEAKLARRYRVMRRMVRYVR